MQISDFTILQLLDLGTCKNEIAVAELINSVH